MYQRSRYLIDPKVQWSIASMITYHWAVFLLCLVTISAMVQVVVAAGQHPFVTSLTSAFRSHVPILGMMILMLPIFLRDMLKLTNRFAGPMFRLRLSLSSLARRRPTSKIRFRSQDFWQEVADDFNAIMNRIEELESEVATLRGEKECLHEENETLEVALSVHQGLAADIVDDRREAQARYQHVGRVEVAREREPQRSENDHSQTGGQGTASVTPQAAGTDDPDRSSHAGGKSPGNGS